MLIGVDNVSIVDPSARGRKSIRMESRSIYRGGIFTFDVDHMPEGCGTWPSLWLESDVLPDGGEIGKSHNNNNTNNDLFLA